MRTVIRALSFVAFAMATHAGFGTAIIVLFNDAATKYPEPLRRWWLEALFYEASIGLATMIFCCFLAKHLAMHR